VRKNCTPGSVRGAPRKGRSYRDAGEDMRQIIVTIVTAIALAGCRSSQTVEPVPVTLDTFQEKAIYARLKSEPVPLPTETPYANDQGQLEAFNEGFRRGWECAISGSLLHGTFGTPTDMIEETRRAWSAGWQSGTKMGSGRWMTESQKLREESGQPGSGTLRR